MLAQSAPPKPPVEVRVDDGRTGGKRDARRISLVPVVDRECPDLFVKPRRHSIWVHRLIGYLPGEGVQALGSHTYLVGRDLPAFPKLEYQVREERVGEVL